jgi:ATP-binding cassette, subfamily B, bacterial PglK
MFNSLTKNALKVKKILTESQRRKTIYIVFLLIIAAILEMFSIGLVVPLIGILLNGNLEDLEFFNVSFSFLDSLSSEKLVIYGISFMVLIYVIKAAYLALITFYQSNYIYDIQKSISFRLLKKYVHAPYIFHIQNNPSQLINNVINEVNLFTIHVTVPLNIILSELFVVVTLLLLLFIYEPVGSLIVFIFLIITSISFYAYMRKNISNWGLMRQKYDEKRLKSLQEVLYGSKEIKILGREDWFENIFSENNNGTARVQSLQRSFLQLPRLVIEVLAIISLLLLISVMTFKKMSMDQMIMIIGLFTAISFRIAPSVNKVLVSFQEMRYASSIINKLKSELKDDSPFKLNNKNLKGSVTNKLLFNKSLNFDAITYTFPSSSKKIIDNVDLTLKNGEFYGIVGESGSGKTTFLNLILGLIQPVSGAINVDGVDIQSNIKGWFSNIGYVPQSVYLIDDSIQNNIAFGVASDEIDDKLMEEVIKMSGLESLIESNDDGIDFIVGDRGNKLSGGQVQRIGIARALYNRPSVLILDEATSSLDQNTENVFIDTIYNLKGRITIIFVSHKLSALQLCDRIFEIKNGNIIELR